MTAILPPVVLCSYLGLIVLLSSAVVCSGLNNDGDSDIHLSPSEEWKVRSFLLSDPFLREKFRSKAINRPQGTTKRYGVVPFDDSTHVKSTKTRHFPADDKYDLSFEDFFDHRKVETWIPITELLFKGFQFDTTIKRYPAKYATDTGFTEHTKAVIESYTQKPYTNYVSTPKVKYQVYATTTPKYGGYHYGKMKYDSTTAAPEIYASTSKYDNKPRYESIATTPKYDTHAATYSKAKGDTYELKDKYQGYSAKPSYDTYATQKYDTYSNVATPTYDAYDVLSSTHRYDTYGSKPVQYDTIDYQKKLYDHYPDTTTPAYHAHTESSISEYDTYSTTPKYNTYKPKPIKYDTPNHQDKLYDRYHDTTTTRYHTYQKPAIPEYNVYSSTQKYDTSPSYKGLPSRYHDTPPKYSLSKEKYTTTALRYREKASIYNSKENTDYRPSGYKPLYSGNEGYDIYVPEEYSDSYFAIPGVAGKDYPIYDVPPPTKFNCGYQDYAGYYADVEASCQVFHICQADGRANAFLCPNGTIFNQQYLVCDWWYNFNCETAPSLYKINAHLYEDQY